MRAREDHDAPGVIEGYFTLYDTEMHALVDPTSTHSSICIEQLSDKLPSVEPLAYDMHVTSVIARSPVPNSEYESDPGRGPLFYESKYNSFSQ